MKKGMVFTVVLALLVAVFGHTPPAAADREELRAGRKGAYRYDFPLYEKECSSCHFLYQPWLLPGASWERIIQGQEEHFGEDLALDAETLSSLKGYLVKNSAEKTTFKNEWSRKILKKLKGEAPLRITETPYMRKEHKKLLKKRVFDRESIRSFSNCAACHRRAGEGDYEEDFIKIPR